MNNEILRIKDEDFDKIPFKKRMDFHIFLIKLMLGEKPKEKTDKEWSQKEVEWGELYGDKISEIIDNQENRKIRNLIMEEKYSEAASIVIEILKEKELKIAA